MSNGSTTTDLIIIEKWITSRHGTPCIVKETKDLLRVRFDSMQDELEEITWARFFQIFKEKNLQFLYEESEESRFYKFVSE
jgi:hypothetical protein